MSNNLEDHLGVGLVRIDYSDRDEVRYFIDTDKAPGLDDNPRVFRAYVHDSIERLIRDSRTKKVFDSAGFKIYGRYSNLFIEEAEKIADNYQKEVERLQKESEQEKRLNYAILLGTSAAGLGFVSLNHGYNFEQGFYGAAAGLAAGITALVFKEIIKPIRRFLLRQPRLKYLEQKSDDYFDFLGKIENVDL